MHMSRKVVCGSVTQHRPAHAGTLAPRPAIGGLLAGITNPALCTPAAWSYQLLPRQSLHLMRAITLAVSRVYLQHTLHWAHSAHNSQAMCPYNFNLPEPSRVPECRPADAARHLSSAHHSGPRTPCLEPGYKQKPRVTNSCKHFPTHCRNLPSPR
jgi:hypothetical protein